MFNLQISFNLLALNATVQHYLKISGTPKLPLTAFFGVPDIVEILNLLTLSSVGAQRLEEEDKVMLLWVLPPLPDERPTLAASGGAGRPTRGSWSTNFVMRASTASWLSRDAELGDRSTLGDLRSPDFGCRCNEAATIMCNLNELY